MQSLRVPWIQTLACLSVFLSVQPPALQDRVVTSRDLTVPAKIKGFLGTYHPYKGTVYASEGIAEGTPIQQAFAFGENAIISQAKYNGYTFAENIRNSCHEWDVNKIYGILRPPSEKGVINQPADIDLMTPYAIEPGMIQGAWRFSELSKRCPQIVGVIIDDFYNDYPRTLTLDYLGEIKAALAGHRVAADGRVDRSSPATTPHLKLYIVVYNHQLDRVDRGVLPQIDGVSFWIYDQNQMFKEFDRYLDTLRQSYPGKEIIAGVYVYNSGADGTMRFESVRHLLERTIDRYNQGDAHGLLLFSAIWMSREKVTRERWSELALPQTLERMYYPHLAEATGRVIDARSRQPIRGALVTVDRQARQSTSLITRKRTGPAGEYVFGAWIGRTPFSEAPIVITVQEPDYGSRQVRVSLSARTTTRVPDIELRRLPQH